MAEVTPDLLVQDMVGRDIADVFGYIITKPLSARNGCIIELNARPGLRMHLYPSEGKARNVGKAVIDTMFPPGDDGRIPIVAITGVNGKTTTTRLIAHILTQNKWRVGMTSTDGLFVGDRMLDYGDCSGPRSARSLLAFPGTDAAVLEIARGGILREGLPFDYCDVAVLTNIGEGDHLGISEIDTPEQLAEVKRCIVAAVPTTGTAVLNAADPLVVNMANAYERRIIFFALDGNNEVIKRHRQTGGRAIFARDGFIIRAEGEEEAAFISLNEVPITHGGRVGFQVANTLAAVAAAWALGINDELIAQGVRTFRSNFDQSAGRFNVLELNGITVIVDYGHNVDALRALMDALKCFNNERRILVYSSAGDRRDIDIIKQGHTLAPHFDEAWLYEGDYTRGREPGDIMRLLSEGINGANCTSRTMRIECIQGHLIAVDSALASARPGDLVMIQADTAEETVLHLRQNYMA